MIKPSKLQPGDKVAIVSLSRGILGEPFASHELELGEKRLIELGLQVEYMPNSRKGVEYIKNHPEARAEDLKQAFADDSIRGIICAIGGDDTYKTIPYLLDDSEFVELVKNNPKVFLGFSDTTSNHLMFYKLGLQTYYGQAFLTDFAEFAESMLPYTKEWSDQLLSPTERREITSSSVWYEERSDFGPGQVGVDRVAHKEARGHEVLRGAGVVKGGLLGGCIESLYDQLTGERYADEKEIIAKYEVFPTIDQWYGKVLFAETSEEKPSPEKLQHMLGVLNLVAGTVIDAVSNGRAQIILGRGSFTESYPLFGFDLRDYEALDRKAIAIAGDDESAVSSVAKFVDSLGFDPLFIGGLKDGRILEAGGEAFGANLTHDELSRLVEKSRLLNLL